MIKKPHVQPATFDTIAHAPLVPLVNFGIII